MDGQILRYTKVHQNRIVKKWVFPSETGFQRELYNLPGVSDPWDAAALEHSFFSPLDHAAALSHKALVENGLASTSELRSGWATFLSSLFLRTPYDLDATVSEFDRIVSEDPDGIETEYQKLRNDDDPPTLVGWIKAKDPNFKRKTTLIQLQKIILDFDRNDYFVKIPWLVLDVSNANYPLLISDGPLMFTPMKLENGHIALPISPTKLFVASEHSHFLKSLESIDQNQIVKQANSVVCGNAREFVCSSDDRQDRYVRNRFGKLERGTLGVRD